MTPLKKVFFDMGEKVGFTNCVFEKLSSENTIFIVFSENTAVAIQKLYVNKNRQFMRNGGLFLNMTKRCFCVFLQALMLLWFVFCLSGKVARVLNLLVFPNFGTLWGGLFLFIWVGRFRCFCVSCLCFSFLCWFCFCFVCFVFLLLFDVVVFVFVFS